jgi:isopentenyl phosphate kinase
MLRAYREIIQAPDGWRWAKHWKIDTKHPFILEHGDDWGGSFPHLNAAIHNGRSTIMGHHHSKAGVEHVKTNHIEVWGMVVGSLIDFSSYAFEYARSARFKPVIGCGVVVDSGKTPIFLPLES